MCFLQMAKWVDNPLMMVTAKYGSHHYTGYGENVIKSFSHYKSMVAFWQPNQEADHQNLSN